MATDPNRGLPLQVRGPVRYVFNQDGSEAQTVIRSATEELGFPVEPAIEWTTLWPSMQESFADAAGRFVPTIEGVVTAVIKSVHSLASQDDSFADRLIEVVQKHDANSGSRYNRRALFVFVEASANVPSWLPQVAWEVTPKRRGVVIYVSPSAGQRLKETTAGLVRRSVEEMFSKKENDEAVVVPQIGPINPVMTTAAEASAAPIVAIPASLPSLEDLPGPSVILSSTAPYLARVVNRGSQILIECTHEPVLTLISQYLERWSRSNPNDSGKVPYVRVELIESVFGRGGEYECLAIKPYRSFGGSSFTFGDMVPLALLQGPLGFRVIEATDCLTILKRDSPFA